MDQHQFQAYYRYPSIYNNTIAFVAEDNLWQLNTSNQQLQLLTANDGRIRNPHYSPNGEYLSFTSTEEGSSEIYLMRATGGAATRLTFLNSFTQNIGWKDDNTLVFCSNYEQMFRGPMFLFEVDINGGLPKKLIELGAARTASFGSNNRTVVGRFCSDTAYWKRYRGGRAGVLWINSEGNEHFAPLLKLKGNLTAPMFIGERIYFLSDHEGIANIYSCTPEGSDLQQHTHHTEFYARNATTDGKSIVYHHAADIYRYDLATGNYTKIEIPYYTSNEHLKRKFVPANHFLETFDLNKNGSHLAVISRGKPFSFGAWEGAVSQQGDRTGKVRYKLCRWLNDGERLVMVSDQNGQYELLITTTANTETKLFPAIPIGIPYDIKVSPTADHVLLTNHRQELIWIDLESGDYHLIDQSNKGTPFGLAANWSPDGRWIAYVSPINSHCQIIKVYSLDTKKSMPITQEVLKDFAPSFSSCGKYLFFSSARVLDPVYDTMQFDLNFPNGMRVYVVHLQKNTPSILVPQSRGVDTWRAAPTNESKGDNNNSKGDQDDKKEKSKLSVHIDFEGIFQRIQALPVAEANYYNVMGGKNKVFYMSMPAIGARFADWSKPKASLKCYDFEKQEEFTIVNGINDYVLSADTTAIAYLSAGKIRLIRANREPDERLPKGSSTSRKHGWIDLNRIKLSVESAAEWQQIFDESWRLVKEFFWTPDISKIDWEAIYQRYAPLVRRLGSRSELSDLIWELNGELGTSHAYESGGDYRPTPSYHVGALAANYRYNKEHNAYQIVQLVKGDAWAANNPPPLARPGVNISEGMLLLAINGQPLSEQFTPQQALVNLANCEVSLTVADADGNNKKTVTVHPIHDESYHRYRDWVDTNKQYVHEKTDGRVGYVHVPNMGPWGYAEFHRNYLVEHNRDGLIIDVRFNGGGHVSALLLEKLARKRIGYNFARHIDKNFYPRESPAGPLVAITNESAGSDGDIFSHSFKLMNLGKLIGKRTWGGVIGIWPRNLLVDGGRTTQPEFAFWFADVGWQVENYGTEPDIEVDISPTDYAKGKDPQLDRAIAEILQDLSTNPPFAPQVEERPNLGFKAS